MSSTNPVKEAGIPDHARYITGSAPKRVEGRDASFSEILTDSLSDEEADTNSAKVDPAGTEQPGTGMTEADYEYPETSLNPQPYEYLGPLVGTVPQSGNQDYSAMIYDALREEAARMSITAGAGYSDMPGGMMQMQSQGIEQMILSAASSGQIDDAQIALFMLCMMMQTNQDGDFGMLMQMMASMLTQIQGNTNQLLDNVISSGYDPSILNSIGMNVFGTRIPGLTGTNRAILPVEGWLQATPAVISTMEYRNPLLYRAVVNQFGVENSARYQPRDGKTYCNIFMWDVTAAMGAEIPHYTDPVTGEPRYRPNNEGAIAMNATRIDKWLQTHGQNYGWREVDAETAQMHANMGRPAVTTSGSNGHVQVVVPSIDGGYDPARGVTIAQAGSHLTSYTYITNTYSAAALRDYVRYWVHN